MGKWQQCHFPIFLSSTPFLQYHAIATRKVFPPLYMQKRYYHVGTNHLNNHHITSNRGHIVFTRRSFEYIMNATIKDKSLSDTEKFFVVKILGRWFLRDVPNFNYIKWCNEWNKRKSQVLSPSDLKPEE
jgi:hypothetical protein